MTRSQLLSASAVLVTGALAALLFGALLAGREVRSWGLQHACFPHAPLGAEGRRAVASWEWFPPRLTCVWRDTGSERSLTWTSGDASVPAAVTAAVLALASAGSAVTAFRR